MGRRLFLFIYLITLSIVPLAAQQKTYCNPLNIDYGYTPIPVFAAWGNHRTTADPVIVNYKETYYLFSTNQWGYWWSDDMLNWHYIARKFLRPWNKSFDELCAPAVGIIGDTMIVFGSTYTSQFSIWMSTDPKNNKWKPLVDSFEIGGWDPDFFTDHDGKLYMYNGSSNTWPLYGIELDRKTFKPIGTRKEMILLQPDRYGWQRFGEHMDNTFLKPFIEGAHMTRHGDKYYLQFGAPGTEFSGYADGVAVGDHPIGHFKMQSDPLSFKPGGFVRGAGHGSTFQDNQGKYWHVSTSMISVKNTFERRIAIWPAGFDPDGTMWCNTGYGDYPLYLPQYREGNTLRPEWYLLNYHKPVTVSSTLGAFTANNAVDENMKTYWSARSGDPGEWITTDLGSVCLVHAIQLNYADQDVAADRLGKPDEQSHRYNIFISDDGKKWKLLTDRSASQRDAPHDYIELPQPVNTRFIKLENVRMPTGKFALAGLRVFGLETGPLPDTVQQFVVLRTEADPRSAFIKWKPVAGAYAYQLAYGISPTQLHTHIMVYGNNEYWLKTLDKERNYYFTIEAIGTTGRSAPTRPLRSLLPAFIENK